MNQNILTSYLHATCKRFVATVNLKLSIETSVLNNFYRPTTFLCLRVNLPRPRATLSQICLTERRGGVIGISGGSLFKFQPGDRTGFSWFPSRDRRSSRSAQADNTGWSMSWELDNPHD